MQSRNDDPLSLLSPEDLHILKLSTDKYVEAIKKRLINPSDFDVNVAYLMAMHDIFDPEGDYFGKVSFKHFYQKETVKREYRFTRTNLPFTTCCFFQARKNFCDEVVICNAIVDYEKKNMTDNWFAERDRVTGFIREPRIKILDEMGMPKITFMDGFELEIDPKVFSSLEKEKNVHAIDRLRELYNFKMDQLRKELEKTPKAINKIDSSCLFKSARDFKLPRRSHAETAQTLDQVFATRAHVAN